MKKFVTALCAILLCLGSAFAQEDLDRTTLVKDGDKAPQFTATMLDGTQISSDDLAGKVVLLNFWATWCPPCRKEVARLQEDIVDRFAGRDFVLIAVAIDEKQETVEQFMKRNGYHFPAAFDGGKKLYGLFAESYIPRNFLIGPDGTVLFHSIGYTPEEFDGLVSTIGAALDRVDK